MKRMFIKSLDKCIDLNSLVTLEFNDEIVYRNIIFNLEEEITYSIDYTPQTFSKIYIIKDVLDIDINDKNVLTKLHKQIIKTLVDDNMRQNIEHITSNIFKLFDDINFNSEYDIIYDDSIDIQKIFNMFNLRIDYDLKSNYLEALINYFKIYSSLTSIETFITFNLTNILTEDEYRTLKKELDTLNVSVIDFSLKISLNKQIDYCIDEDFNIL